MRLNFTLQDASEEVVQLTTRPFQGHFWVAIYSEAPLAMDANATNDAAQTTFTIQSRVIPLAKTTVDKRLITQSSFLGAVLAWLTTSPLGIALFSLLLIFLGLAAFYFVWRTFRSPDNQDGAISTLAAELGNRPNEVHVEAGLVAERSKSPLRLGSSTRSEDAPTPSAPPMELDVEMAPDHFISSLMDNGDATSASTTSSSTSTVHASSARLPATATFLERERQRKMMYRRRMKDEAAHLQEMCTHLESRRVQLIRRRERRLQQSPEEKRAIEQWALTVQRIVRHALHHMNLSLANDERKRDNIHRLLVHQRAQLEHIRVKWVNSSQTDIAHAEIVRCRRFQNTQPAVAANRIWLQLTGDTTHHSTAKLAPRIAQVSGRILLLSTLDLCLYG
ncbi:hypothetical protein DYB30_000904 [Aphanomyces astaci]|uniref:Transmembrane protein n=1 Tax=Aphanomyces astaci TaxID=112090 RepID=A0A397E1P7_APHAT|nr:hypothetical protein DYB30_000904 [Aphanomyces astaci]RHY47078.1 hypothetical protein DYB34_001048 [Aphanomyces astaci]RHY74897.1 hypothetical protein DYB38_001783 [Aphanomyces astaci]RHZ21634.1 hypothetical protein DYB26_000058 [Aphanomyces astaci]